MIIYKAKLTGVYKKVSRHHKNVFFKSKEIGEKYPKPIENQIVRFHTPDISPFSPVELDAILFVPKGLQIIWHVIIDARHFISPQTFTHKNIPVLKLWDVVQKRNKAGNGNVIKHQTGQ